jgi:hypothetical protein
VSVGRSKRINNRTDIVARPVSPDGPRFSQSGETKGFSVKHLEVIEVQSKVLKSVIWDHKNNRMMVKFIESPIYVYPDVPRDVFDALIKAKSKGQFFANIKRQFPKFVRLDN